MINIESNGRICILVVDDEVEIRSLVEGELKDLGFEVLVASSVRQARQIIQNETVHIVITDLAMPEENGSVLINWIIEESNLQLPVVVYSGMIGKAMKKSMFEQGVVAVLVKPFQLDELAAALDAAMIKRVGLKSE